LCPSGRNTGKDAGNKNGLLQSLRLISQAKYTITSTKNRNYAELSYRVGKVGGLKILIIIS
jgi:hypothetical protein